MSMICVDSQMVAIVLAVIGVLVAVCFIFYVVIWDLRYKMYLKVHEHEMEFHMDDLKKKGRCRI
jgi:uncharacterized membrane protein YgaE (UPF0421/DUF939 family)